MITFTWLCTKSSGKKPRCVPTAHTINDTIAFE
jgi:hypothetical protein